MLARTDSLLRLSCASTHARRALRQSAAGAVLTYVRHLLPPTPRHVAGVDVAVACGRIDVLWRTGADLLIDEIKTGEAAGTLSPTTRHVERYLRSVSAARDPGDGGPYGAGLDGRVSKGRLVGARVILTVLTTDEPPMSRCRRRPGSS